MSDAVAAYDASLRAGYSNPDKPSKDEALQFAVEALTQADKWFREYADMHRAKGSTEKAETNDRKADWLMRVCHAVSIARSPSSPDRTEPVKRA